jgi:MYXO-CTERM domain-containing protein
LRGDNPSHVFVYGNDTAHFSLTVERGSSTVPTPPTQSTGCAPSGSSGSSSSSGSSGGTLADTGVSTTSQTGVGVAALAVGLVLTIGARRRRRAH